MKKQIVSLVCVALCMAACQSDKKFGISGTIANADGQMVYLEQASLPSTIMLDSVRIKAGKFAFKAARPEYPEIYQLRLGTQTFVFPIDSCERIHIAAHADSLAFPKEITGSEKALQIQELRRSVVRLQSTYNQAAKGNASIDTLQAQLDAHKQMAQKMILQDTRSMVSYFAIFQKVGGYFLFSPYEKADRPYCAAVATAFSTFMPNYYRSKNLYNLVMDAIRNERQAKQNEIISNLVSNAKSGFLDIELPDVQGTPRALSSLLGKVVLLDFSAFAADQSVAYTFALRDLYNRYAKSGFEIYQVSADQNLLLWQTSAKNLPWICVRDESGASLNMYNVQALPTRFLMDKSGTIVNRGLPLDKLPQTIEKLLK